MSKILTVAPLGMPWPTVDPFLFCVHHNDAYPRGNAHFGPAVSLAGRQLGQDFAGKEGWNMYHGQTVPGFPQHPHRGFETVTIVRRGLIDHSDSLGATARFGQGDVQWLTAGAGIVHAEMFPLLDTERDNPLELFQIWLNLPKKSKLVPPHFTMLWSEELPRLVADGYQVVVVAGTLFEKRPPAPPPNSWAQQPDSDLAIVTIHLDEGARLVLPKASQLRTVRNVYFFAGHELTIDDRSFSAHAAIQVRSEESIELCAKRGACEVLLLQGCPIGEPIVQHGPFVMNSQEEILQAFADYRRSRFGGWPWPTDDPVHDKSAGRFARHADGRIDERKP